MDPSQHRLVGRRRRAQPLSPQEQLEREVLEDLRREGGALAFLLLDSLRHPGTPKSNLVINLDQFLRTNDYDINQSLNAAQKSGNEIMTRLLTNMMQMQSDARAAERIARDEMVQRQRYRSTLDEAGSRVGASQEMIEDVEQNGFAFSLLRALAQNDTARVGVLQQLWRELDAIKEEASLTQSQPTLRS